MPPTWTSPTSRPPRSAARSRAPGRSGSHSLAAGGGVGRDAEAASARRRRGVHPDHAAGGVEQRPSGVARLERRVRLDEPGELLGAAVLGRGGDRPAEAGDRPATPVSDAGAARVPDRAHRLADGEAGRLAGPNGREAGSAPELEHRHVVAHVVADDARRYVRPVPGTVTRIVVAPAITWLFVSTSPEEVSTIPCRRPRRPRSRARCRRRRSPRSATPTSSRSRAPLRRRSGRRPGPQPPPPRARPHRARAPGEESAVCWTWSESSPAT